jgi:hypothetical protein
MNSPADNARHARNLRRLAADAKRNAELARVERDAILADPDLLARGINAVDHLVTRLECQARSHSHTAALLLAQADRHQADARLVSVEVVGGEAA